jgi:tellurite resistance protein TerC
VLRGVLILAGAALLDAFHWMIHVFGGFLVVMAVRMPAPRASRSTWTSTPSGGFSAGRCR